MLALGSVLNTSVSDSIVSRWQVPFTVTPSGHSWTVYSTKLAFTGTASNETKNMVRKGEIGQINTDIQADTVWWYGFCSGMAIVLVLQTVKCYPRWIIICKEEQSTELSSPGKLFNFSFAPQTKAWPDNKVQSAVSNPLRPCQIRLSLWLLRSSNGTHLAGRSCAVCSYTPRASS